MTETSGYINASGQYTSSSVSKYTTSFTSVKPNTTYVVNGSFKDTTQSQHIWAIYCYNQNKEWIDGSRVSTRTNPAVSFTTPENCYYIQFQHRVEITVPFGSDVILEEVVNEPTNNSKWWLKHNIKKIVLDGTQAIAGINTNLDNTSRITWSYLADNLFVITSDVNTRGLSNRLICPNSSNWNSDVEGVFYDPINNGNLWVRINKTIIGTTESEVNTWVSNNNIIIYAPVETLQQCTPLNDTLQEQLNNIYKNMLSYKGTTNISQVNNDLPFIINSTAYIDNLDGKYESLKQEIAYIGDIPTKTSDLTNDSGFITNSVNNLTNYTLSSSLSTVAISGSYTDLSNKPTIPTKVSDLTNDSGFITNSVNNLTNYTKTSDLISLIYPIGSIYMSVNNVSPATFIGGTWEQIQDTFLLAAGNTYSAGSTGGEATHTLTIDEIPSHTHNLTRGNYGNSRMEEIAYSSGEDTTTTTSGVGSTGGGQAHNNMPPYLTVYMWKRTA